MPFSLLIELRHGMWTWSFPWCLLYAYSDVFLCSASIVHMSVISLDRYLGISKPLKMRNTSRSVVAAKIVFVWLITTIISSPLAALAIMNHSNILRDNICVINHRYYMIYGSTLSFLIPFLIMALTFLRTRYLLKKQASELYSPPIGVGNGAGATAKVGGAKSSIGGNASQRDHYGLRKTVTRRKLGYVRTNSLGRASNGRDTTEENANNFQCKSQQHKISITSRTSNITGHYVPSSPTTSVIEVQSRNGDGGKVLISNPYVESIRNTCGDVDYVWSSPTPSVKSHALKLCHAENIGEENGLGRATITRELENISVFANKSVVSQISHNFSFGKASHGQCAALRLWRRLAYVIRTISNGHHHKCTAWNQAVVGIPDSRKTSSCNFSCSSNRNADFMSSQPKKRKAYHTQVFGTNSTVSTSGGRVAAALRRGRHAASSLKRRSASMELANEDKATRVLAFVFSCFFVCWTPFFLSNFAFGFCGERCALPDWAGSLFLWLGYTSSTLNPIIYTVFNERFRQAFLRILRCRCAESRHHNQHSSFAWHHQYSMYSRAHTSNVGDPPSKWENRFSERGPLFRGESMRATAFYNCTRTNAYKTVVNETRSSLQRIKPENLPTKDKYGALEFSSLLQVADMGNTSLSAPAKSKIRRQSIACSAHAADIAGDAKNNVHRKFSMASCLFNMPGSGSIDVSPNNANFMQKQSRRNSTLSIRSSNFSSMSDAFSSEVDDESKLSQKRSCLEYRIAPKKQQFRGKKSSTVVKPYRVVGDLLNLPSIVRPSAESINSPLTRSISNACISVDETSDEECGVQMAKSTIDMSASMVFANKINSRNQFSKNNVCHESRGRRLLSSISLRTLTSLQKENTTVERRAIHASNSMSFSPGLESNYLRDSRHVKIKDERKDSTSMNRLPGTIRNFSILKPFRSTNIANASQYLFVNKSQQCQTNKKNRNDFTIISNSVKQSSHTKPPRHYFMSRFGLNPNFNDTNNSDELGTGGNDDHGDRSSKKWSGLTAISEGPTVDSSTSTPKVSTALSRVSTPDYCTTRAIEIGYTLIKNETNI